jgi:hypothetical protein
MALVANSKMLRYQFWENTIGWTFAVNNINHLASIPKVYLDGSGIGATPRATFSVANLHVNHPRARTEPTQEVRAVISADRAGRG